LRSWGEHEEHHHVHVEEHEVAKLLELEQSLGWTVPRIACATLELEVGGRIGRLPDGAFAARSTKS
jgi:hypothetical protein